MCELKHFRLTKQLKQVHRHYEVDFISLLATVFERSTLGWKIFIVWRNKQANGTLGTYPLTPEDEMSTKIKILRGQNLRIFEKFWKFFEFFGTFINQKRSGIES